MSFTNSQRQAWFLFIMIVLSKAASADTIPCTDAMRENGLHRSEVLAFDSFMSLSRAAAIVDTNGVLLLGNAAFEQTFAGSDLIDQVRCHIGQKDVGEELRFAGPDGRTFRIETIATKHGWLVSAELTERLDAARTDGLTQLGNRMLFREELTELLAKSATLEEVAILTVDLDRFKAVNEALGRGIGDEVLRIAAKRILAACDPGDIVARLHGDAFGIIQAGRPQPQAAATLAARLIDSLSRSYLLEGQLINIAASAGIVLPAAEGLDRDQVMKNAELALGRAKKDGRGAFRFFETAMDERMRADRALEIDLRRSLAMREFALVYQPQLDLRSMRITGFEALLRWHCPARGIVPPLDFIPLAEQTGIIVPIGEWVLRTACREAAGWPNAHIVCVNISAVQFASPGLIATVLSALAESGLNPRLLELEITESVLLDANGTALQTLTSLRELGVRVSLDDFGTGYSSLGYLRSFPFDKIKIDQSFVRGDSNETSGRAIVRAIAMLGESFGIATVAEGVETTEQMSRVTSDGCTHIQGYLISRPLQSEQIDGFLRQSASTCFNELPQSQQLR